MAEMRIQGTVGKVVLPRGFCFVDGDDGETYFLQADELEGQARRAGGV